MGVLIAGATGVILWKAPFFLPAGYLLGGLHFPTHLGLGLGLRLPAGIEATQQISDGQDDQKRHSQPQDKHPDDDQHFQHTIHLDYLPDGGIIHPSLSLAYQLT